MVGSLTKLLVLLQLLSILNRNLEKFRRQIPATNGVRIFKILELFEIGRHNLD
jgi:hypothetical protein